jgi:hypothetical protein
VAKITLDDIKAKADEYAKLAKKIERTETARDSEIAPFVEKHEKRIQLIIDLYEPEISKLQARADAAKAEVMDFLATRKGTFADESDLADFGVVVGTKPGNRTVDPVKLVTLCKKKGVEIWDMLNVVLKNADKLLGKKEVDEISTNDPIPTRDEYLRLK